MAIETLNRDDSSLSTTNQRPYDEVYQTPRFRSSDSYRNCQARLASSRHLRQDDENCSRLGRVPITCGYFRSQQTRYNTLISPPCEGTLPWYRTCFSTSWCCWDSCGSASCCIMPGQTSVPEGIRGHTSLCRRASAPATRSRFLASPASLPVPPVSRPTNTYPSRPVARHPVS